MPENTGKKKAVPLNILSITVNSQVTACLNGTPVKLPNWVPGLSLEDGDGSSRPGIFALTSPQQYLTLELRVNVKGSPGNKPVTLTGKLAGMTFTAAVTGDTAGEQTGKEITLTAVAGNIPADFKQARGDMEWYLNDAAEAFAKTRLELYWIYHVPGIMYKKGVWVEVLRLLADLCAGLADKEKIIQRIVNYCHAWTPLQYNSETTAGNYAEAYWGGYFKLEAFLQQTYPLCNCYDLAGALQTLLAALGIPVKWIYMNPFGFINEISLIGRGETNNPVFLNEKSLTPELIYENDENRTKFGAHSFCLWEKEMNQVVVLDACLGPSLGNAPPDDYLKRSIDYRTSLYNHDDKDDRPGGPGDMYECTGIIDVSGFPCTTGSCQKCPDNNKEIEIREFKKRIGFAHCGEGISEETGICCDWQNPLRCPDLGAKGWEIASHWLHAGCTSAAKEWKLARGNEYLKIIIFVTNQGITAAKNRLLTIAASTALPGIPFNHILNKDARKPTPALGHCHVFFHKIEIWAFYNVCFLVDGSRTSLDLVPITHWLQEQAEQNVVANLSLHLPVIGEIIPDSGVRIKAGEEANIQVIPGKKDDKKTLMLEPFFDPSCLRLVQEKPLSLDFRGIKPGKTDVALVLVNKQNLLCSAQNWEHVEIDASGGSPRAKGRLPLDPL